MKTAFVRRALPMAVFLFFFVANAGAQGPAPSPILSPAPTLPATPPLPDLTLPHDLTKADLEPFLDALIPSQLQNRDIAGAVVAIVKDGQVLLAKGYGYADFAARKPVVADETLFRPGSISKVFAAIAIMQLVEQGKLDLDRDVSDYIDFTIPKTFPEPVTLRRLLTHTAGFEETLKNLFVPSAREMRPFRDYLVAAMPARIFPPGKVPSYSNYGLTLAGYIVERVSGEAFDKYVAAHILDPLQMSRSSFSQPLPDNLASGMSEGYLAAANGSRGFEFVQAAPAGALSATATDMTRLMLALLGEGTFDGATILKPESVQAMESRQLELHPALRAIGLVLMDYSMNGQRIVGHGGDTIFFHSDMMLMPEARVGLFVSYNSAGSRGGGGRTELIRAFLDRYFPAPVKPEPAMDLKQVQADGRAASGVYETSRRGESTFLKMTAIFNQASVYADREGILSVQGFQSPRGGLKRWREVGPLLYREIGGPDLIAFRRDPNGVVTELLPFTPVQIAQRVTGFRNKRFLVPLLSVSFGFIVLTLLLWPVAAVIRRRYARPLFATRMDRALFLFSRMVCAFEILFLLLIVLPLSFADKNLALLGDGLNPWLTTAHVVAWAAAAGQIVLIVAFIRFWRGAGIGWWTRVHASLLLAASVAFMGFAWWAHLLTPSLKF